MATDPHAWQPGDRVLVEAQIRGDGDVNVLHVDGWALDFFPRDAVKIHPAAPAGTGGPTPADAPAAPYVRALGELRIALLRHGVDTTVDTDRVAAVAIETLDNLRAELSQVQRERDAARESLKVVSSLHADSGLVIALAGERDEARSALAALRAEVGKIAAQWQRSADFTAKSGAWNRKIVDIYDRHAARLRALVTDQSPAAPVIEGPTVAEAGAGLKAGMEAIAAAPPVCRCLTNEAGDIRCHNCGERVNKRCWKCGTPRGDGPCPTADLSPTSDTQTDTGGERSAQA